VKPTDKSDIFPGTPAEYPADGPGFSKKIPPFSRTVFPVENRSFDALLNETFSRLENKRNADSLRRIYSMGETLKKMELELDELIDTLAEGVSGEL
jgi:hypothetical protein